MGALHLSLKVFTRDNVIGHLMYKIRVIKLILHKMCLNLTQSQSTPQKVLVHIDKIILTLITNLQYPLPIHTIYEVENHNLLNIISNILNYSYTVHTITWYLM